MDHDAVMDSWERVEIGMALLAQTHNLLRHLDVGAQGREPRFANHLEPADVPSSVRRGIQRILGWGPTAAERRLAAVAEEFAEQVTRPRPMWPSGCPGGSSTVTSGTTACSFAAGVRYEVAARRHAASVGPELAAARRIMTDLDRWSDAFA